jgi:orotate phosphoribosyltransferase
MYSASHYCDEFTGSQSIDLYAPSSFGEKYRMPSFMLSDFAAQRAAFLSLIARLSFQFGDFLLAAGQKSDFYIDCRKTTLDAEGGRLSGMLLAAILRDQMPDVKAIGGLTMGADPLVSNTATASAWWKLDHEDAPLIHGFLVRKQQKVHGTGQQIEGFVQEGIDVAIVDDVCTTGGSTLTAVHAARAAGMNVAAVLCLVDREQGGRQAIEAVIGCAPFISLYTQTEVREEKLRQQAK